MSSNRDLSALGEAPGLRDVGRGFPGCCFQGPREQIGDNREVWDKARTEPHRRCGHDHFGFC